MLAYSLTMIRVQASLLNLTLQNIKDQLVRAATPGLTLPGPLRLTTRIKLGWVLKIPLPNEQARLDILKIHAAPITKHGDIDYEAVVKLSEDFNGADLRNVCTEAGMFAIRAEREYVISEDFMKAVRKVGDTKKLESKLDYKQI